jgi:hypothetical protein
VCVRICPMTVGSGLTLPARMNAKLYAERKTIASEKFSTMVQDVPTVTTQLARLVSTGSSSSWWRRADRRWQHTAHNVGFLPMNGAGELRAILGLGEVKADESLKNQRIKIALNALRVADYPGGGGTHRVLFEFWARNQVPGTAEDVHFNATYRVRNGEQAPIQGYPIFVGLCVGAEGVGFRFRTINVKNDTDEVILDILEGDAFKQGLKLVASAQPGIAPFVSLTVGLTRAIAKKKPQR